MTVSVTEVWFGPPQIEQIEARIARRRLDAYSRVVDAEGLPRSVHDRAVNLLVRGNLLTPETLSRLQRLRAAVSRVRNAHTSTDLCTRSLLSVHAGLSLLLLDCESYQRRIDDERRPTSARREKALAVAG